MRENGCLYDEIIVLLEKKAMPIGNVPKATCIKLEAKSE